MDEQLLQKLLEWLRNTEDFVTDQLPDFIQQVLKYEKISTYLSAGLMIVLLCIAISIGYYYWKHRTPPGDNLSSDIWSFFGIYVPCIASPILFIQLCCSIDKLVKIYIAPKYFLLNLLAGLKK